MKILIVDDEPMVSGAIRRLLKVNGHTVDVCLDAKKALLALQLNQYDLVLSDMDMPGMTGRELKRDVALKWPDVPFLLMSGGDSDVDIPKPINTKALLNLVSKVAPNAASHAVSEMGGG